MAWPDYCGCVLVCAMVWQPWLVVANSGNTPWPYCGGVMVMYVWKLCEPVCVCYCDMVVWTIGVCVLVLLLCDDSMTILLCIIVQWWYWLADLMTSIIIDYYWPNWYCGVVFIVANPSEPDIVPWYSVAVLLIVVISWLTLWPYCVQWLCYDTPLPLVVMTLYWLCVAVLWYCVTPLLTVWCVVFSDYCASVRLIVMVWPCVLLVLTLWGWHCVIITIIIVNCVYYCVLLLWHVCWPQYCVVVTATSNDNWLTVYLTGPVWNLLCIGQLCVWQVWQTVCLLTWAGPIVYCRCMYWPCVTVCVCGWHQCCVWPAPPNVARACSMKPRVY